jgi:hypothetical protein
MVPALRAVAPVVCVVEVLGKADGVFAEQERPDRVAGLLVFDGIKAITQCQYGTTFQTQNMPSISWAGAIADHTTVQRIKCASQFHQVPPLR